MNTSINSFAGGIHLNEFQVLMRRWKELGPYNAGHVVQISGGADVERWQRAVRSVLADAYPGMACADSAAEPVIECAGPDLSETIRSHLNHAFTAEDSPFRFFLIDDPDGSHWFGTMFDHWIADSHSMRQLMRRCVRRFQAPENSDPLPPLSHATKESAGLSAMTDGPLSLSRGMLECARSFLRHRRAFRVWLHDPADFSCGFLRSNLRGVSARRIVARAKEWGVSVNDIFLATIAQTLGKYTAVERYAKSRRMFRGRRDKIALATAVDIRRLIEAQLESTLGCLLSYYTTVLSKPEIQPPRVLAQHISRQTGQMKSRDSALRFYSSIWPARMLWDRWPGGRERLFHKCFPLLAGLSNVNLTGSWVEDETPAVEPRILDYIRISPAGPMLPLVFTLTTIGDRFSLCLTYRNAAFSPSAAALIAENFAQRLSET